MAYNEEQFNTSRPMIEAIMKGLVGRDLYEDGSYYKAIAPLSKDFNAALQLINDPTRYEKLLKGK